MKAISKTFPYSPIMNIESKLSRAAARRIDLLAGVAERGEFAEEPRIPNVESVRQIDMIDGPN